MKNKMISTTIIHIILLIIVCLLSLFGIKKIYNILLKESITEKKSDYITINTDKYRVECMDYYFTDKFFYDETTYGVFYPRTFLVLRLKITNTSKEDLVLSNNYKISFKDKTYNLKYGFNKYRLNVEPGKSVVSNVAYEFQIDEDVNEYYVDFDGNKLILNFE